MEPKVTAQLHSSSGRSSKILKDREAIEAVVEVAGAGTLILKVDGAGGYSLRAYPERVEEGGRDLLAVGVLREDEIVAIRPEGSSAEHELQALKLVGAGAAGRVSILVARIAKSTAPQQTTEKKSADASRQRG